MKAKILAVDDSRTIRDLLRAALENAGFDYHCANDGAEGVQKYGEILPDAVITDINMPVLDGYGVINELRRGTYQSTVPILVLTTESSDALKAKARDAGATGWIVKPFDDKSLVSVLQRVIGVH
jgi:two-component system chemotaxis response regulator CheY